MSKRVICEICGRVIPRAACYVVRIEVFADPSMPDIDSEELSERDLEEEMRQLMEEMKGLSADELQDQVHRRFDYRVCRPCQIRFLANPLGKPRKKTVGRN